MEIRSWFAALEWSPNGNHIATVGKLDSTVYVWDSTTGQNVTTYHHNSLEFVSWAPDSIRIASVGRISLQPGVWQTIVHVWDAAKGEKICEYQCEGPATAIWSPDGKWIVSSDKSGAIHIWHPSTGQERLTYRGHSESVPLVA
jgi:eukaryotic-like serine/threonine-protein kinase